MKQIILLSIMLLLLSGCNHDNNSNSNYIENTVNESSQEGTELYFTRGGNFDRSFSLSNAYANSKTNSVLALGTKGELPFIYTTGNGREIKTIELDKGNIKSAIDNEVQNAIGDITLYMDVIYLSDGLDINNEALEKIKHIKIVPEGTSIFQYPAYRIDNLIKFANHAKSKGVEDVSLLLWKSIDFEKAEKDVNTEISRLPSNGIPFEAIDFDMMRKSISQQSVESGVISSAFYTGALSEKHLGKEVFVPSDTFDHNKENVILFGSYTRRYFDCDGDPSNGKECRKADGISYVNQSHILKKLEMIVDKNQFNIIFKGHPSEITLNTWIDDHPDVTSSSYFKSIPYEVWSVVGGGTFTYTFDGTEYELMLPNPPKEIYSIFSTTLYSENPERIKVILGYNNIDEINIGSNGFTPGQEGELLETESESGITDKSEYDRWVKWTDINTKEIPFEFTYDWIDVTEK